MTDIGSYAGVGSRATPPRILALMTRLATMLQQQGWTLHSGGAKGADTAFYDGLIKPRQCKIWLADDATKAAIKLSSQYHPAWDRCSAYARQLHGRNAQIMLGDDLNDPVKFVICWTKGGLTTGGTGQALRIAQAKDIPIFNLFYPQTVNDMERKLKENNS